MLLRNRWQRTWAGFLDCLQEIGVHRRFSSHGLRRTANDLIRRVASGEVARAITGHVTVAMTDHCAHVDTGEKRAAVEGMLRLIQGGAQSAGASQNATDAGVPDEQALSRQLSRHMAPENRHIVLGAPIEEKKKARSPRRNRAFLGAGEGT